MTGPYIMIIHTGGNHWLTIEGVHSSLVRVYDSVHKSISLDTQLQIASLTLPSEKYIDVHIQDTQYQVGKSECGVYAIAFAVEMCFGNNPASYR